MRQDFQRDGSGGGDSNTNVCTLDPFGGLLELDPVYPRLGGQVREPSAAGPSEIPLAIARDQVDEQIGQDDVGLEPPRQPRPPHL